MSDTPDLPEPAFLDRGDGHRLAYRRTAGTGPGIVFLGGFKSDMTGSKALALEDWAKARGRAFLRFDYLGHGESSGGFEEGTIGRWADDAIAALDALTEGPQILIGSSMGGWIMLLAALARPERVAALVGIAPAPDFTEDLMWAEFSEEQREQLLRDGRLPLPSPYAEEPTVVTRRLVEEGRDHLLLRGGIPLTCPLRILQGRRDPDVPWPHALRLEEAYAGEDVKTVLIKDGDHRLSREEDLRVLKGVLEGLVASLD
ncbi:alpha/beta hydrolase [Aquibaculum arenosum]|uniref:Palmitoyl-protein thioesterase ABHD10, mitochondrial n=1 Tax=Aquibaculum arenosum TaxID=3032591 RepID=A0ABT5YPF8_9PROT|nr:alpha/beta hydrolase [Fodinicurvata sp. CAU 1616]MDF2096764.1 alpha/beta hydrolase [Fodinicurvata sp. CAU 1616]